MSVERRISPLVESQISLSFLWYQLYTFAGYRFLMGIMSPDAPINVIKLKAHPVTPTFDLLGAPFPHKMV